MAIHKPEQWETWRHADALFDAVAKRDDTDARQLRRLAALCCRRVWDHLPGEESRQLLLALEAFLDGTGTWKAVQAARKPAIRLADRLFRDHVRELEATTDPNAPLTELPTSPDQLARAPIHATDNQRYQMASVLGATRLVFRYGPDHALDPQACDWLRCLFANPFRSPVMFAKPWRTATAEALAASIYAARAFDQLPVLADALEDAGCDATDLLAHLRGPGPHIRGCWALDLVLGKS